MTRCTTINYQLDKDDFTKAEVVDAIREFIPNFEHEEKGKNLDSKM